MPQIPGHAQSEFLDHLKAQGVTHKREQIDPRSVQATQNQLNPTKVMRAVQGLRSGSLKKGAVVSSDNKIIDGHHQWAAVQVLGRRLDVVRINAPASRVMAEANRFAQYHGIKNKSA
jgi:ParB-like chromosome segregation protein Spo0J